MKKRLLSIALAMALTTSLVACKDGSKNEPVNDASEESVSDSYQYNITALLTEDNTYNQVLLQGFSDCLSDYIGEEHFTITTSAVTEETPADLITSKALGSAPDMIFTAGKSTLVSASEATDTIPIVATDIIDFKGTLHIPSLNGASWDKTTGINVTGISSKPSIVDQVSLMIEATDDLQTVGIFFSPEDTDAIYQNEIFEAYLDQAGIPWKEYLIPVSNTTIDTSEHQNSTALTPSKFVAFSAKEGMDNDVTPINDKVLLGLNSQSSTRTALVSEYWTEGKTLPEPEVSDEDSSDSNKQEDEEDTTLSVGDQEISLESQVGLACQECSAIYIPFGSMLTDQMDVIGDMATASKVTVVAGDTEIGQDALVTLFSDPYALGYYAGKKAVRVFNGEDISTVKIGYGSSDDSVKLYNGTIAEEFGKEFPKSFSEINEFLDTYEYGSNTVRYSFMGD
ncbi:MAG: hypothetical protein K6F66_03685 [Pseudobutyrivibrio sp.]|nr:hypothetical protein [Pseudobutyrivibrio sp.]